VSEQNQNKSGNKPSSRNRRTGQQSGGSRGRGGSRRGNKPSDENRSSKPRSSRRPAATAPPAPPVSKEPLASSDQARHTKRLTLSAWDLARTRKQIPDTPRGQIMTLRAHQKLLHSFELERNISDLDRSFIRINDDAKGACLLVHGVTSSPGDMRGLALVLHEAGFNVYVLRLPDYGTPGNTISEVSWESAMQQVLQSYRLLARGGGKVHMIGLGFGASLGLHLAREESLSSLVLMAPSIMPQESFFQRMLVRFKLHHLGFVHRWMGWNADLMEGMDKARGGVSKLKTPIYAAQCEDDDHASPASLRFLQRKSKHKGSRFQVFPTGGHGILAAHGEDHLYAEIVKFCSH
jgi:esterase/lipase